MENTNWIPGVPVMHLYEISADGGQTWTKQWLTDNELAEMLNQYGYLIRQA